MDELLSNTFGLCFELYISPITAKYQSNFMLNDFITPSTFDYESVLFLWVNFIVNNWKYKQNQQQLLLFVLFFCYHDLLLHNADCLYFLYKYIALDAHCEVIFVNQIIKWDRSKKTCLQLK